MFSRRDTRACLPLPLCEAPPVNLQDGKHFCILSWADSVLTPWGWSPACLPAPLPLSFSEGSRHGLGEVSLNHRPGIYRRSLPLCSLFLSQPLSFPSSSTAVGVLAAVATAIPASVDKANTCRLLLRVVPKKRGSCPVTHPSASLGPSQYLPTRQDEQPGRATEGPRRGAVRGGGGPAGWEWVRTARRPVEGTGPFPGSRGDVERRLICNHDGPPIYLQAPRLLILSLLSATAWQSLQ